MLHAEEHTANVDVHQPVQIVSVMPRSGFTGSFDTGIVEGEVEPTEHFDSSLERGLYIIGARHVASDGESLASCLLNQLRRFFNRLATVACDDHACSFDRKRQCRRTPDAGSSPGHEGDLAAEAFLFSLIALVLLVPRGGLSGCPPRTSLPVGQGRTPLFIFHL